jgi:hypothetical protein
MMPAVQVSKFKALLPVTTKINSHTTKLTLFTSKSSKKYHQTPVNVNFIPQIQFITIQITQTKLHI